MREMPIVFFLFALMLRSLTRLRPAVWPGISRRRISSSAASTSGDEALPPSPQNHLPYPRAAVAAVALRPSPAGPQVLVVRRARPPHAGSWSFPGGSLELGETVVEGAGRELFEECGVRFQRGTGLQPESTAASALPSLDSAGPTPFTASDAIEADPATGAYRFHYAIIQVAGLVNFENGTTDPVPGDDAAAVGWVDLAALAAGGGAGCAPELGGVFTPGCAAVAREAAARFWAELAE